MATKTMRRRTVDFDYFMRLKYVQIKYVSSWRTKQQSNSKNEMKYLYLWETEQCEKLRKELHILYNEMERKRKFMKKNCVTKMRAFNFISFNSSFYCLIVSRYSMKSFEEFFWIFILGCCCVDVVRFCFSGLDRIINNSAPHNFPFVKFLFLFASYNIIERQHRALLLIWNDGSVRIRRGLNKLCLSNYSGNWKHKRR